MGEVTDFPAVRFRITPPARSLSPNDRLIAAYEVVSEVEPALRMGNDPTSGLKLLIRTALTNLSYLGDETELRTWAAEAVSCAFTRLPVDRPPSGGAAA